MRQELHVVGNFMLSVYRPKYIDINNHWSFRNLQLDHNNWNECFCFKMEKEPDPVIGTKPSQRKHPQK